MSSVYEVRAYGVVWRWFARNHAAFENNVCVLVRVTRVACFRRLAADLCSASRVCSERMKVRVCVGVLYRRCRT